MSFIESTLFGGSALLVLFGLLLGMAAAAAWFTLKARYAVPPNWPRSGIAQSIAPSTALSGVEIDGLAIEVAAARKLLERDDAFDADVVRAIESLGANLSKASDGLAKLAAAAER